MIRYCLDLLKFNFSVSCLIFFLSFINPSFGQHVELIKIEGLEKIIFDKADEVKVINFWATWCKPCIKELPYFESLGKEIEGTKIRKLLVNMNFADELESKVLPFIRRRNIRSEVKLLDELDYNEIIDRVDKNWSGAIPATLIIGPGNEKRIFLEKEFKEGELQIIISNFIKTS